MCAGTDGEALGERTQGYGLCQFWCYGYQLQYSTRVLHVASWKRFLVRIAFVL